MLWDWKDIMDGAYIRNSWVKVPKGGEICEFEVVIWLEKALKTHTYNSNNCISKNWIKKKLLEKKDYYWDNLDKTIPENITKTRKL